MYQKKASDMKEFIAVIPAGFCGCRRRPGCLLSLNGFHKLPSEVGPAATSCDVFQFVVTGVAVGMEISMESFEEFHGMAAASGWLVIIKHDEMFIITACAVKPHIGFGLRLFPFLLKHLNWRFVTMKHFASREFLFQMFYVGNKVILGTSDNPVCHSGTF